MHFGAEDSDILRNILAWRRDVRRFRSDPLNEAEIDDLHATMDLAPSVGNSRPWRVIRADSAEVRAEVRDVFAECNAVAAQAYEGQRREEYDRLVLAGIDTAPLQLAVFTETSPAEGHGLGRRTMPETLEQSTAMAIHTLWLAARARNIGMGMVSILDPNAIERILAVPRTWRFSAWLCLGYPEAEDNMPLLHRVGWQENVRQTWECR